MFRCDAVLLRRYEVGSTEEGHTRTSPPCNLTRKKRHRSLSRLLHLHEQVRSSAIALLGRLFTSRHAEYGTEVPKIWLVYLGRFKDVDAGVSFLLSFALLSLEICWSLPLYLALQYALFSSFVW